ASSREEERKKVSQLRKKISERLVAVKNETAMLTTFNEVDMSGIMAIRKKYQEQFVEKYGIKLGFMSFFTKAVTEALQQIPAVNSYLDGDEVVSPKYCDIGIAVQTDKGLMVPVIRNAESMSLAELEHQIADLATRARKARLGIEEMSGGTFTISNGGIYGSMLSTPILNPPQSAILGMHNILERPVAINGKVEVRPMMYIALSYDHRVIDGKDSVGFLKTVKALLEEPVRLIFGEQAPEQFLLDI
ncbi:MAG: dihydrolipoyllysine-residue succinyltransferase, partial [Bacteroidales bacterium]|nr:dihydrolipoyllysine-residue succinyltransferase [Bacteroidales bacterium]